MISGPRRRVYKVVSVQPAEAAGHGVLLDGRSLRTPARKPLVAPFEALAEAIAEEWRQQGETIEPDSMPLTQLACTALDLIDPDPEPTRQQIADYAGHELLCYRVATPEGLAERQVRLWDPLLDWAAEQAGGAGFELRNDLDGRPQPQETQDGFNAGLNAANSWQLAALASAVTVSGSAVLGKALIAGRLSPQECFEAAELDALYQIDVWGEDREARMRLDRIAAELAATRRFADLLAN